MFAADFIWFPCWFMILSFREQTTAISFSLDRYSTSNSYSGIYGSALSPIVFLNNWTLLVLQNISLSSKHFSFIRTQQLYHQIFTIQILIKATKLPLSGSHNNRKSLLNSYQWEVKIGFMVRSRLEDKKIKNIVFP